MNAPRLGETVVRRADSVPWNDVKAGSGVRNQVLLGPNDGTPNFSMRRFAMAAGGGMPRHTNSVEHEQYVLRGRATVTVGATDYEVAAGDVLLIPASAPHSYQVLEAPFEFLCLVPNLPDQVEILSD